MKGYPVLWVFLFQAQDKFPSLMWEGGGRSRAKSDREGLKDYYQLDTLRMTYLQRQDLLGGR